MKTGAMQPTRSMWKGHIRFSLITVPVKIYNAVDTATKVKFNELHKDCNGRVGRQRQCKKCSATVESAEIVKGYQFEKDQYAIVSKNDIESVKLKSTKVIEIVGFVSANDLDPMQCDAPYYIGADGAVGDKAYMLLYKALKKSKRIGIGKVVLRDREDLVAISATNGSLTLLKLRYPDEIRDKLDLPKATVDSEELKLTCQLIDSMAMSMDDIELVDQYRMALNKLVVDKMKGQDIAVSEDASVSTTAGDVLPLLKQAIKDAKKKASKGKTKKAA